MFQSQFNGPAHKRTRVHHAVKQSLLALEGGGEDPSTVLLNAALLKHGLKTADDFGRHPVGFVDDQHMTALTDRLELAHSLSGRPPAGLRYRQGRSVRTSEMLPTGCSAPPTILRSR